MTFKRSRHIFSQYASLLAQLVFASEWKTARVDVLLFKYGGWVGWGGILTFMYLAYIRGCYAAATSLVRGWVGWGGILTFMYLPYIRGCYAAATSLVRGWVGWDGILTFMYLAYIRGCYAAATCQGLGGVGWDINVQVPCVHAWMLRCCCVRNLVAKESW